MLYIWIHRYRFLELHQHRLKSKSLEGKSELQLNCMNMLLWPVMLYELNEFIKHREMDDDLAFEWETSK